MKILMTGFEPFGGEAINPSWEAVRRVKAPGGAELARACLPVTFGEVPSLLKELIERERPDAVICVGQAGGRDGISLERIAVNLMDGRIPDNSGFQPKDEPLQPGGPAAYFSSLPLRRLEAALKEAEIPAHISNTAGLYVCNCAFYTAAALAAKMHSGMRAGFIHVPFLPEQTADAGTPSLCLEADIRALETVCRELVDEQEETVSK